MGFSSIRGIICFAHAAVLLSRIGIMFLLPRENRVVAPNIFYTSVATRVTNSYERVVNFEIAVATVAWI